MIRWASQKFSRKLALAFVSILLASTAATDVLLSRALRTHLIQELAASLLAQARFLRIRLRLGPSWAGSAPGLRELSLEATRECGCRVTFIAADGRVLADSNVPNEELPEVENHRWRPEVRAALSGKEGSAIRHSATIHKDLLYAAVPYAPRGDAIGVIRLAFPLTMVERKVSQQSGAIAAVSSLMLVIALLAALALSRSISQPVEDMVRVADNLARGNYEDRLRSLPSGELGRLGGTINALAEKVRSTVAELSQEKAQLAAVLSNMEEGVMAVDAQGRVLLINPALARILGVEPAAARNRPFVETLRQSQIVQFLDRALSHGTSQVGEARLFSPDERVFEVHAMPMLEAGRVTGALAVLHDITRLRRLEQVRRDFVANVSHELRTPLVSIKGFAETLMAGAVEDAKNRLGFLETIEEEADRMSRLVDDLLELAAIESGSRVPSLEAVDPLAIAREVSDSLKTVAEKRGISLLVRRESEVSARADPAQLRQVFMNLIVNAIKFNKENGSVEVWAQPDERMVSIFVRDTGIGIPPQDLPRIFERFYRVDKARSRELGGTGLGLAIVKHIIEAHGGSVSVKSVEDQGSTFQFTLLRDA